MVDDTDRKRRAAASFGEAAEAYRDSDVHRSGSDLDRLASWCQGATRALDVATGAGHTAGAVARTVPKVVAADAAPEMVATAEREYDGIEGVVADAERLPFATDSFEAVTCRIAAHHFPDPEAFVAEVARVLEPGGTFAFEDTMAPEDESLADFINRVEVIRDSTHVESYSLSQWREWLEDAGFVVEESDFMKFALEFDSWTEAQSLPEVDCDRVENLLLEAGEEATELFEIEVEDGSVRSFANLKGLVCATRLE